MKVTSRLFLLKTVWNDSNSNCDMIEGGKLPDLSNLAVYVFVQLWPLFPLSCSLEQNTVFRLAYFKHRSRLVNYIFWGGFCLDPDSQYNFERMIWGRSCSALFISPVTLTSLGLFLLMSSAGSSAQEHIPRNSTGVMGARWLPLACLTFMYGDGG